MGRVNGEYYIGIRSCYGDPEGDVKYNGGGRRMTASFRKHPGEWTKKILCELPSREGCASLEHALVPLWRIQNDPLCLNLREGGERVGGGQLSVEARLQVSRTMTGKKKTPEHIANMRHWSTLPSAETTRAALREKNLGRKHTPETAAKMKGIGFLRRLRTRLRRGFSGWNEFLIVRTV